MRSKELCDHGLDLAENSDAVTPELQTLTPPGDRSPKSASGTTL